MNYRTISLIISFTLVLILTACIGDQKSVTSSHNLKDFTQNQKADGFWNFASPKSSGMNAAKLNAMLSAIDAAGFEIHSITIVKNGKIVMDCYGKDKKSGKMLGPDDLHEIHSVTKSITSALLCIAMDEGKISGVSSKMMTWFSGYANKSPEKDEMTLEDLLTMRSGLQWNEGPDDPLFFVPENSAKAILDRPLTSKPGTNWVYSSGNSQILGQVLRQATGLTPKQYADEKLFGPLGIVKYNWMADKSGTNYGGWGLFMRPRDLALFGYLCLNKGFWKDKQLISSSHLKEATAKRTATPWNNGDYGYHWWIPFIGGFAARGYVGQAIYVFPDKELVVVFTANLDNDKASSILDNLISSYILPSL
jgi:CubicO group peptidase (beta-lactamase class C family)